MRFLKSKKNNLIITIVTSIVCFVILHKSGVLDNAGMAAIFMNWLPIVIGIFTIVIYFIANAISKKYSWIIIILGNLFNIIVLISLFF